MKERYKDLETIKEVFDKFGVKLIVGYGLLLGMYRDGKPIEHDDDIDLIVVDNIDFKTRKEIGKTLGFLGFRAQPIAFNVLGSMEMSAMGMQGEACYDGTEDTGIIVCERNFKFTIFFFNSALPVFCRMHNETELVCVPKLGAKTIISIPQKFIEKQDTIKINGVKYLTPYPIVGYLSHCYLNWKDKNGRDHSPTYDIYHANN